MWHQGTCQLHFRSQRTQSAVIQLCDTARTTDSRPWALLPWALLLGRACWESTWQQRPRCEQCLSPLGCHRVWQLLIQEHVFWNGVNTELTCQILTHWPPCASDPCGCRYPRVVPSAPVWTITSSKKKLLQFWCNLLPAQSETYRGIQCTEIEFIHRVGKAREHHTSTGLWGDVCLGYRSRNGRCSPRLGPAQTLILQ